VTRATVDEAGELHRLMCEQFLDIIQNGEEVSWTDKETGEVKSKRIRPSPAMYAQIRTFLKDNNISVAPGRAKPMTDLSKAFEGYEPPEDHDAPIAH
jgi:hypothetical protein